jgi:hypothetical protein
VEKGREIITPCSRVLKGTLPSGTSYELVLRESVFVRYPKAQEDDGGLWGIDGGFPWTTISTFSLTLNGQHVSIRRKYFGDLVNINAIAVSERQKDIIVSISGGDAAGSFQGEFVVRNNMLAERIIRMGEMPEEYWERIVIHNEL